MKFPSKFISYKESSISKFPMFLSLLEQKDYTVLEMYKKTINHLENLQEFVDILDALFMLGTITIEEGILHYVETN